MLKILRSTKDGSVALSVIGRIEEESLAELKRVIREETTDHNLVLDLKDVTLVDQAAIRFLARCEAESIVARVLSGIHPRLDRGTEAPKQKA